MLPSVDGIRAKMFESHVLEERLWENFVGLHVWEDCKSCERARQNNERHLAKITLLYF
jgi:hypothetical protein